MQERKNAAREIAFLAILPGGRNTESLIAFVYQEDIHLCKICRFSEDSYIHIVTTKEPFETMMVFGVCAHLVIYVVIFQT